MLLTIIITTYNLESLIDRAITSILKSNLDSKMYEILIIDDGSNDNTEIICKEYTKKYPNIRFITKENKGISDSRNLGIENSYGEYLTFLDGDDLYFTEGLENIMNTLKSIKDKNIDIITGNILKKSENKEFTYSYTTVSKNVMSGRDFLKIQLRNKTLNMMPVAKIFRVDMLKEKKIVFPIGRLHEDELVVPIIFNEANKVYITEETIYYYINREGSITTKSNLNKNGFDLLKNIKELEAYIKNIDDSEYLDLEYDYLCGLFFNAFTMLDKKNRNSINIKEFDFYYSTGLSKKNRFRISLFKVSKTVLYHFTLVLRKMRKF